MSAAGTPASSVFASVAVADDAALDVVGAARHVGQPRRQQSAGARLGDRNRQRVLAQQIADDGLQRTTVGAVDRRAEHVLQLQDSRVQRGVGASAVRRLRGQVQLDLPEDRENRRADRHAPATSTCA